MKQAVKAMKAIIHSTNIVLVPSQCTMVSTDFVQTTGMKMLVATESGLKEFTVKSRLQNKLKGLNACTNAGLFIVANVV